MILVCCVFMRIKQLMNEADAIIIGAGVGLSQAAGIAYGSVNFNEKFPELVERYGMTDMYTSSFYTFETEEERWSYWAKHIHYLYDVPATKVYQELFQLFQNKNYFVITTNVDGQFEKAGFMKERKWKFIYVKMPFLWKMNPGTNNKKLMILLLNAITIKKYY